MNTTSTHKSKTFFKPLAVAVTSLALLTVAPASFAVSPEHHATASEQVVKKHKVGKRKHHKSILKKMARHLDLSQDQKQQIKTLMLTAKQERQTNKATLESFHKQVQVLMQAPEFDEQAYISLREQYRASFDQMALAKVKNRHAIAQVLTPEQREKWQAVKEKRKLKRHSQQS